MPALTFSKWSSGGNTTVFLHDVDAPPPLQAAWARAALNPAILGAEQAGLAWPGLFRLRMAGDEFCVNASRAFGALLALLSGGNEGKWFLEVSGWPGTVVVDAAGASPSWQVSASLAIPESALPSPHGQGHVARLPGICHLVLPKAGMAPGDALAQALDLLREAGLGGEAASGVVWWEKQGETLTMIPIVRVRDAQSLMAENACGSGALALALCLAREGMGRRFSFVQPSGSSLEVDLVDGCAHAGPSGLVAKISGPVTLLARGRLWLDAPHAAR